MDCLNYGIRVDTIPNDGRFSCNCTNFGFGGLNCEIVPLPRSQFLFQVCLSMILYVELSLSPLPEQGSINDSMNFVQPTCSVGSLV
jgi:hypothetical protein